MTVTRQDLHAMLYEAIDSGEWTADELREEIAEVARAVKADQREAGDDAE